ncbi:MAG: indole-3-glycerol phosphate synthase TrpC [Bacteroidota bacterium]
MVTILDTIIAAKRVEVATRQKQLSISALREFPAYARATQSLQAALQQSTHHGIIAEFKRKSPSQSNINLHADSLAISEGYAQAGAAAMSVLTDQDFFGARPEDIHTVRSNVDLPIIRKDFLVDPYQVHEAKAMGADAILLIAACLEGNEIQELVGTAQELGLEVLCEIHAENELEKLAPSIDVVGVNNRNLKDFSVSIEQSVRIGALIPPSFTKISESGIEDPASIIRLKKEGFEGFLIGTYFMRQPDPGAACMDFIQRVHAIDDIPKEATT